MLNSVQPQCSLSFSPVCPQACSPPAAPPRGVSGAVHATPADPVPPLRPDAGAAAPSHALQTLLRPQPAFQTAVRTRLHTARGEPTNRNGQIWLTLI